MPNTQRPAITSYTIAKGPSSSRAPLKQPTKPAPSPPVTSPSGTAASSEKKSYAEILRGPVKNKRGSERVYKVLRKSTDTYYNGQPIYVIEGKPDFDQPPPSTYLQSATRFDICKWCQGIDLKEPTTKRRQYSVKVTLPENFLQYFATDEPFHTEAPRYRPKH